MRSTSQGHLQEFYGSPSSSALQRVSGMPEHETELMEKEKAAWKGLPLSSAQLCITFLHVVETQKLSYTLHFHISDISEMTMSSALSQYGICHLRHPFITAPSSFCHFIGRSVINFAVTIIRGLSKLWKFVNSCMAKLNAILTNS